MGETGNMPLWDLNIGTMTVAFLCLVILIVFVLAFVGGRR